MSLKRAQPGLRFALGEYAVTPDEMDRYEVYNITSPDCLNQWAVGTTLVNGTSSQRAIIFNTILADYPRNLECVLLGTHGNMNGTFIINGFDQFGNAITENFAITNATNGGTTTGTKVFAAFRSGTCVAGTFVGNGTAKIGYGTAATTTLFGLPVEIGGTADVVKYSWNVGTGSINVNGGTIGAYVGTQFHCVLAPSTVVGSLAAQVWIKSTYNAEDSKITAGTQQV
jgi:hypothetical protein